LIERLSTRLVVTSMLMPASYVGVVPRCIGSKTKQNRYLWHLDEVFLRSDHKDVDLGQVPKER
jgi:hypothetical protein